MAWRAPLQTLRGLRIDRHFLTCCSGFSSRCVTQVAEADSPQTLQALAKAEEQNRALTQQLSCQAQRCQQLAEQLQSSEGAAAALRHKVSSAG